MIQNAPAEFTVQNDEQVTVKIEAIGLGCNTKASYDGNDCLASSQNPDVYIFTVTGNSGDAPRFVYTCFFSAADPNTAKYVVTASGDQGGGDFPVRTIFKPANPPLILDITFTIA